MKKITALLSLLILTSLLLHFPLTKATTPKPTIYVSIVSHNEEPNSSIHPDFTTDYDSYKAYRDGTVAFATMLKSEGAKYDFQSDWNYLLAEQESGTSFSNTKNKNLLEWLVETEGFAVEPHAHESTYSIADVAYLIKQLGVTPANIVGGFIASPASSSKVDTFQDPIPGWKYNTSWTAEALYAPGTSLHIDESSLWISGIWRAKSDSAFLTDDTHSIPVIGNYGATWDTLDDLLAKRENGELDPNKMYTASIMTLQADFTDQSFIDDFQSKIETLKSYTDSGAIEWVTLPEALDIWENDYNSTPTLYSYEDGDLSPTGTSSSSNRFSDVTSSNTYYDAIEYMYDQGFVEGYDDGTYQPNSAINRAEFTKILIESSHPGEAQSNAQCFTDVETGAWYTPYICYAKASGIVGGYADLSFQPGQEVNVAEALKITLESYFTSIPEVGGEWYQKYWDYAESHGYLLSAWTSPSQNLTRGEMAELIYRIENFGLSSF